MVPDFPEFDDQYYVEMKRREEVKKQRRKQQALQDVVEEDVAEEEEDPYNWPAVPDDAGDDANDGDDDQFEPPQIQWDDKMFGSVAVEAFGGEFINSIGSSGSAAATYEELVRRHVENFLASAAKYAQTSEVARRVAEWEEKITPKLEEEEQHDPFDIHEYGTSVLEGLQKNQPVLFRKIVAGKPDYQISRLFLATLQLANVNNVELSCPGELYEGMDKLAVRLLSKKRHHEELAEYRAPSLAATAVS
nr:hypothetical protein BaRGS_012748 [Batillaria attramentaria]